jgi:hypothetical protein
MAIISDFQEDQDNAKPSSSSARTAPFSASLDPSRPLGFLEKVFDFLGEESDFLERDTAAEEIVAAVKVAKEKRKMKKAEAEEKAAAMEVEKKQKEKKEKKVEAMEVEKTEEEKSGLRGTDYILLQSLSMCSCFALKFLFFAFFG